MLNQMTSLSRNGLKDWYVQRVSAYVLLFYFIFLVSYIVGHHPISFAAWYALFHHTIIKAVTVLALLSLIAHAWVGIWTVLTDYVTCAYARLTLITLMILAFVVYFVWAIEILWG
ncbi:MAG: succinate dehydrogenase, hydrophobic membrane anchor protein [Gammaproteobacteria bacterium]|jgi:succinate dehydrogenase / fumarate reductase membrane anchor subunit|nr:succinate dehydrogenase, hydrophobic membrane anchor protein [Gammaproteobacteria bacterium]